MCVCVCVFGWVGGEFVVVSIGNVVILREVWLYCGYINWKCGYVMGNVVILWLYGLEMWLYSDHTAGNFVIIHLVSLWLYCGYISGDLVAVYFL